MSKQDRTDGATPTRKGARRRTLTAVVTALACLVVVGGSAAEVVALQHRAARSLEAEVALADVAHQVDGVRYWPSGFIHGAPLNPSAFSTENGLRADAATDAARLAGLTPRGAAIQALVTQLNTVMGEELKQANQGPLSEAQRFDATIAQPLYNKLLGEETRLRPTLVSQARQADHEASVQLVALVVGAAVLLVLVVAGFEATRRRRLRAVTQADTLRASEERFRALVQHSSDMITVVDADGHIIFQAPSVHEVLGYDATELAGTNLAQLVHPDDLFHLRSLCHAGSHSGEQLRLRRVDGAWRACEVTTTDLFGHPGVGGMVLNIHDVTERNTLEDELRHQAFHDSLTGLANRALFADRLDHALARRGRTDEPLAVLLIDLDDFKAVNDSLGHGLGDRLLGEVAARLRGAGRASDTVARLGGDEFAILLEDPTNAGAPQQVAQRVLAAFESPFHLDGRSLIVTPSIGVARAGTDAYTADDLVRNADVAMYAAKAAGKNRLTLFESGMYLAVQERLQFKTDLTDALLAGDQMELYYQPVVRLDTAEVVGVEALLRWNHPTRGLVAPLDFLPLAEETGLIVPLGRWVLRQACAQAAHWRDNYPDLEQMTMSVNLSGRELEGPDLVADVADALTQSGLDPAALVLEITETVLVHETERTIDILRQLKALGLTLAIDDFGTGYSSLGYLHQFPFDVIKVDRSFTGGLGTDSHSNTLTQAVVNLGATLGLKTVAEGVEIEVQADHLRAMACEYGQGYLYSKPLPAADCEQILRRLKPRAHTH